MTFEDLPDRALTDNELAIDWAHKSAQNDMLRFEVVWLRSINRTLVYVLGAQFILDIVLGATLLWWWLG